MTICELTGISIGRIDSCNDDIVLVLPYDTLLTVVVVACSSVGAYLDDSVASSPTGIWRERRA